MSINDKSPHDFDHLATAHDLAELHTDSYRPPVVADGWDSLSKHEEAQGFYLVEGVNLAPWADLSSAELVHRLKRPEREAREAKRALGRPARLDFLDGGLRDRPIDLLALLDGLAPPKP